MGILDFLKAYQLDIMLVMVGICGALAYLTTMTAALSRKRKWILSLMELSATLLLLCDRFAYIYDGDASTVGIWMTRVCNFMVYFCILLASLMVTLYLIDLYSVEGKLRVTPKRLNICIYLAAIGAVLLVISQFTGLYYSFDAHNQYQRAAGNAISYVVPLSIAALQASVILQHRKLLSRGITIALLLNLIVPVIASIVQFSAYGVSLTNMTTVGMVIFLYTHTLRNLGRSYERARTNEIETYKEANRREHALFEQTAEALASAIDAKDEYTCGHSTRVAAYSQIIARAEGLPKQECDRVYFAALLHDVGKIGVADDIISKPGGLTDEEFAEIKRHPVYGYQILSNIRESPYLSIGAHYHHERYDGRGYPEGLAGEDIPELARIIGVADSYDAMTSKRSYRDVRPQQVVRQEFVKGMGTQFDPHYARIMLHLMDLDEGYYMREQFDDEELGLESELRCDAIYHECSAGIRIVDKLTHIHLVCTSDEGYAVPDALPSLILFDSLDGFVHDSDIMRRNRRYFEYAQIRFDGQTSCTEARKIETSLEEGTDPDKGEDAGRDARVVAYDIEAVRRGDHMQVRIVDGRRTRYGTTSARRPRTSRDGIAGLRAYNRAWTAR